MSNIEVAADDKLKASWFSNQMNDILALSKFNPYKQSALSYSKSQTKREGHVSERSQEHSPSAMLMKELL